MTDGGEVQEAPAEGDAAEQESGAEEEPAGEAEEAEEAEETEAEETPEAGADARHQAQREAARTEDGARLLHLNLDGLFLDLLGLEVDLDEVTLDLTARTGEGKLLGNLLAAVSDLLSGDGPGSLLSGGLKDLVDKLFGGLLGGGDDEGLNVDTSVGDVGDRLRSALRDAASQLPIEELISQVVTGLVQQLLEEPTESEETDDDEETSEADEESEAEA